MLFSQTAQLSKNKNIEYENCCVRLSGLEPEITEPKSVVFPITPQPGIYIYFHKPMYTNVQHLKYNGFYCVQLNSIFNPTLSCFVLIFKDSSGIFKYTYSHEPVYYWNYFTSIIELAMLSILLLLCQNSTPLSLESYVSPVLSTSDTYI